MSIYGGFDPWSAPAIPVGERKQVQFWKRDRNHYTFIGNPSAGDRAFAPKTLAGWLGLPIEEVGQ